MRYGEHPYFENYRKRDRLRYEEWLREEEKKAHRVRRVTGRILTGSAVEVAVAVGVAGAPVPQLAKP